MKSEARQVHGEESWLVSYALFDGSGAIALSKVQAEPDGEDARWIGSGRTVVNNKGNPVKQYEPYFSASWDWETEEVLEGVGVMPIFYYDSLGRLMRTELPNGTLRRALFTPWRMEAWDENDTVSDADHLWYAARQPTSDPELQGSGPPHAGCGSLASGRGHRFCCHHGALVQGLQGMSAWERRDRLSKVQAEPDGEYARCAELPNS